MLTHLEALRFRLGYHMKKLKSIESVRNETLQEIASLEAAIFDEMREQERKIRDPITNP